MLPVLIPQNSCLAAGGRTEHNATVPNIVERKTVSILEFFVFTDCYSLTFRL